MSRWNLLHVSFLIGTLGLALVLVPLHLVSSLASGRALELGGELLACLVMYVAAGMGVTAGYHRLFSHRAYRASWIVRFGLLCLAAASFQDSALKWCSNHRLHHRFVDTDQDPYTIKRGFWHAHWIWVMENNQPPIQGVADLERDPLVKWQYQYHYFIGGVVACLPLGVGLLRGDLWGYAIIAVLLRIVLTHHSTFLINSAAHWVGSRPNDERSTARDSGWLALFTLGEGYHNFHHRWPGDFRNGVRWYQFDCTKWLIVALSWVGLVSRLRRVPESSIRRARLAIEQKWLRARLEAVSPTVAAMLERQLLAAYTRLDQALASLQPAMDAPMPDWATLSRLKSEVRQAWLDWQAATLEVRRLA